MQPHLVRCDQQLISASISTDFYGDAPALCSLRLKCRVDDGAAGSQQMVSQPLAPFASSNLLELDIDGRNFAYACMYLPSWTVSLSSNPRPLRISLSNLSPSLERDLQFTQWDLVAILDKIPKLTSLTLHNVEFGRSDTPLNNIWMFNNGPLHI